MTHPEPFRPEPPSTRGMLRPVIVLTLAIAALAFGLACLLAAGVIGGELFVAALFFIVAAAVSAIIVMRRERSALDEDCRLPGEVPPPPEFYEVWPPVIPGSKRERR